MTPQSPKAMTIEEKAKAMWEWAMESGTCAHTFKNRKRCYDCGVAGFTEQIKLAQEEARAEERSKKELPAYLKHFVTEAYAKGHHEAGVECGKHKHDAYAKGHLDGQVAMREECAKIIKDSGPTPNPIDLEADILALHPHAPGGGI